MTHQIQEPKILGKIELPQLYTHKPGYAHVICVCCGESDSPLYKQGNGQWAHDDCIEAEQAEYWEEQTNAQQRYQDRLDDQRLSEADYWDGDAGWND